MNHFCVRRVLVVLSILAVVVVSTAAVAHDHVDANSDNEPHCQLCMALHNTKHALATPIAKLCLTIVETTNLVPAKDIALVIAQPLLTQGRSPPQL